MAFDMHYLIAGRPACYIVWSDGKEVQTWWDIKPGIQKPESLGLALGGATGVSKGSAATIPALLLPGEVWGSITQISGAKLADDGHVGDYECFRIAGTYGRNPMTIWIDKKSHLIRRIDNRFENLSIEQTTTYEPILDEQIPDELLEFNPPAEY